MMYYHGSPYRFDCPYPNRKFFVSPHRELAIQFGIKFRHQTHVYLYEIEIPGDDTEYHEAAQSLCTNDPSWLRIVGVEEIPVDASNAPEYRIVI
jgi:hypothetical protein